MEKKKKRRRLWEPSVLEYFPILIWVGVAVKANRSDVYQQRLVLPLNFICLESRNPHSCIWCLSLIIRFVGFFHIGTCVGWWFAPDFAYWHFIYRKAVLTLVDVWVVSILEL